jgi:hypothetical protein
MPSCYAEQCGVRDAEWREVGRKRYRDLFVVDATEMAIRSLEVWEDFNAARYTTA